ncbi:Kelch repeat-containing protein [Flexithrix dorotheae]|uniref:Kelch repeat-containing protein n=1 Tax=Flexithrix dorotheae TaxID=70993 RepID=UPI00036F910D|nr:putative Ig domain-containing protein [Flexithrix dorotheae]
MLFISKKPKLKRENVFLIFFLVFPLSIFSQTINFNSSGLIGETSYNPTSLDFGPDNRLYVAQQDGLIYAYTITRAGANNYIVTSTETIDIVKNQTPNHDDDGTPNSSKKRQVTGIFLSGTAMNPIIYVSSSDWRIGAGGGGKDLNLDTNSGILHKLTKNGNGWDKIDLVRGFPRSEENHSVNGIVVDPSNEDILYLCISGNTNAGSPSINFAFSTEYAYATSIVKINLAALNSMPVNSSTDYGYLYKWVYDLPTVDDPTRTNIDNKDPGDPFGGNDGLNQARIDPKSPVQLYSTGWRNVYDVIITETKGKAGRMYAVDNGANPGWGGHPDGEQDYPSEMTISKATTKYLEGEPGSSNPGQGGDGAVNNKNGLHFVRELVPGDKNYVKPGEIYYAGHPNPIRANPAGAGLFTKGAHTVNPNDKSDAYWRNKILSESDPNFATSSLPVDWPPLPLSMAYPAEGDFRNSGITDGALANYGPSTNGLCEYTASNFNGAMQGNILLAGFNGKIYRAILSEDGKKVTNCPDNTENSCNKIFASGFGSQPLDVIAQGDDDVFPGTVWAATYGDDNIMVFEPGDYDGSGGTSCDAKFEFNIDSDNDGFSDADEFENGTDPCSGADKPEDHDGVKVNGFFVSNLNDPDDDEDGIPDIIDPFAWDPENGKTTELPYFNDLFNILGFGFGEIGFTGLMTNGETDYHEQFDAEETIFGGTAGLFTIPKTTFGDPKSNNNTQDNAFQFGINVGESTGLFTVSSKINGPYFNGNTPIDYQSQGFYIGNGGQDNFLKVGLSSNGGFGGLQVYLEENQKVILDETYTVQDILTANEIELFLTIDPILGIVQPKYAVDLGEIKSLGNEIEVNGDLLLAIKGSYLIQGKPSSLAIGTISTSYKSGTPFAATWDYFKVQYGDGEINQLPIANAGENKTISLPNNTVIINGKAEDFDGKIESYFWELLSGKSASLKGINTPTLIAENLEEGEYKFKLTVTDNKGGKGEDEVIVKILPEGSGGTNPIQLADIKAQNHLENDEISLAVIASGGADNLKYSASGLPAGLDIEPTNGQIFGQLDPGSSILSPYVVTITVDDGGLNAAQNTTFYWFVNDNSIPNSWDSIQNTNEHIGRHENSFVQVGDKFYLLGGRESNQVEIYDYKNDTWTTGAEAPLELNHFQAVSFQGYIWVIGAFKDNEYPTEKPAENIYLYDPVEDYWIKGPEIPENRRRGSAGLVVYNDKFYLVAGIQNGHTDGWVNWFDEYDPVTGTWTELPGAPRARDHFHACVIGSRMYVASGRRSSDNSELLPEVDVFDFIENKWIENNLPDNLPTLRAGASNVVFQSELVVIGGEPKKRGPAISKAESLNIQTGKWKELAEMNYGRHGTQAIVSGAGIHITSGSPNKGGGNMTNMEVYGENNPTGNKIIQGKINSSDIEFFPKEKSEKRILIENLSDNQGLIIDTLILEGQDAKEFTIENGELLGNLWFLPYQNPFEVIVAFDPQDTADKEASLSIFYGNGEKTSISLIAKDTIIDPLVLTLLPNQKNIEEDIIDLTISAKGGSGEYSFHADGFPSGILLDINTGKFSGTVSPGASKEGTNNSGIYLVNLKVEDTINKNSEEFTFLWTILHPDSLKGAIPFIAPQEDFIILEGESEIKEILIFDPDGDSLDIKVEVSPTDKNFYSQKLTQNGEGDYTINLSFFPTSEDLGSYTFKVSARDSLNYAESVFKVNVLNDSLTPGKILYRVNVGGPTVFPLIPQEPAWGEDTNGSPSLYRIQGGEETFYSSSEDAYEGEIGTDHNSIKNELIPTLILESERWDRRDSLEMKWSFPIQQGTEALVRFYFAETFNLIDSAEKRVFSIELENEPVKRLSNIDPFTIAGPNNAFILEATAIVKNDNSLDIEFIHNKENPSIKAIEIIVHDNRNLNHLPLISGFQENYELFEGNLLDISMHISDFENDSLSILYSMVDLKSGKELFFDSIYHELDIWHFQVNTLKSNKGEYLGTIKVLDGNNTIVNRHFTVLIKSNFADAFVKYNFRSGNKVYSQVFQDSVEFYLYNPDETKPRYTIQIRPNIKNEIFLENILPGPYLISMNPKGGLKTAITANLEKGNNYLHFGSVPHGDLNNDNLINEEDIGLLKDKFGIKPSSESNVQFFDFNKDDIIDIRDFSVIAGNIDLNGFQVTKNSYNQLKQIIIDTAVSELKPFKKSILNIEFEKDINFDYNQFFSIVSKIDTLEEGISGIKINMFYDIDILKVNDLIINEDLFPLIFENRVKKSTGEISLQVGRIEKSEKQKIEVFRIDGSGVGNNEEFSLNFNENNFISKEGFNAEYEIKAEEIFLEKLDKKVLIYPNPSSGIFSLVLSNPESEQVQATIYDSSGKKVFGSKLKGKEHQYNFDLTTYTRGLYLMSVQIGNSIFNHKFVIIK